MDFDKLIFMYLKKVKFKYYTVYSLYKSDHMFGPYIYYYMIKTIIP